MEILWGVRMMEVRSVQHPILPERAVTRDLETVQDIDSFWQDHEILVPDWLITTNQSRDLNKEFLLAV